MMPKIKGCSVNDCFYNKDRQCKAEAINVGMWHPTCETFLKAPEKIAASGAGTVGACKESDCRYNQNMLCNASGIEVVFHTQHADCQTFSPR